MCVTIARATTFGADSLALVSLNGVGARGQTSTMTGILLDYASDRRIESSTSHWVLRG